MNGVLGPGGEQYRTNKNVAYVSVKTLFSGLSICSIENHGFQYNAMINTNTLHLL